MTPDPTTLPVHWAYCGAALELQFANWRPGGGLIHQTWTCPSCSVENFLGFPAKIARVTKREDDSTPVV